MKYKNRIMTGLLVAMLGLGGCAQNQIPDMTDEEMKAMGEFVAFTLMKYDAGHGSRLMDLPPVEESVEESVPAPTRSPEETVGMDPVDDTPVVNAPAEPEEEEISYSAEEVMGLPEGVELHFAGKAFYDSYPEDSDAFAVTAAQGRKLLVLAFSIVNTSEQEVRVDLMSSGTTYRITLNEERPRRALSTVLPNDMAFYVDTLAAGASAEAVLLIEVDAELEESNASVVLDLKNESKSHTILLSGEA